MFLELSLFDSNWVQCHVTRNRRRYKVPHILLSSLEPMERLNIRGTGTLLQTFVCRNKRELKGEMNAKEISDGLPFLEYELHSQLLNKLRVKGMNAIFGLKVNKSYDVIRFSGNSYHFLFV